MKQQHTAYVRNQTEKEQTTFFWWSLFNVIFDDQQQSEGLTVIARAEPPQAAFI